jgi:diguanylate cyclase (GGDEF)-like protein
VRPLNALHTRLERAPRGVPAALALALVVAVGALDTATGSEISSSVFYLAPVGLAAWYAGGGWGFTVSLAAAVSWFVADLATGHVYSARWIPVWNAAVRLGVFVVVGDLLRRLRGAMDLQRRLAETDGLTGLLNARHFLEMVDAEVARATRYGRAVSLVYMDLDGFKGINDRGGHQTGDAVLRAVGVALKAHVRATDLPCRLGGDEFAILFPETDARQAREAVANVRRALDGAMARGSWGVGFSMGVVTSLGGVPPAEELVRQADALMYQVKRTGKGDVAFGLAAGPDV